MQSYCPAPPPADASASSRLANNYQPTYRASRLTTHQEFDMTSPSIHGIRSSLERRCRLILHKTWHISVTVSQDTNLLLERSNSYVFPLCFWVFFMRHRRGNSPLTLSRPISGACHFGPRQSLTTWIASTWRKRSSVEMLRKLKTRRGEKKLRGTPDGRLRASLQPRPWTARQTQHLLNGEGEKTLLDSG